MTDRYQQEPQQVFDPIRTVVSLSTSTLTTSTGGSYTPGTSVGPARSIYVEGSGNLVVTDMGGTAHTFGSSLARGIWHPMRVASVDYTTTVLGSAIKLGW